jgi:peptidoglycan/LPS O-acetylase OafA/YrhL
VVSAIWTGRRFVTLDALRGVAAISVMLFHDFAGTSYRIFEHGYYAVDLFFTLSGVVLTHSYATRISHRMTFGQYMTARTVRLYPFYILGSLLGAGVLAFYAVSGLSLKDFILLPLCAALFLPYPVGTVPFVAGSTLSGALFPLNIPAWSLFFEMLASIALFVVVRKRVNLLSIIAVSFVVLAGLLLHYRTMNIGWTIDTFLGGFPRTAFAFFSGVLIYRLIAGRKTMPTLGNPTILLVITAAMFAIPVSNISSHLSQVAGLVIWLVLTPGLIIAGLSIDSSAEQQRVFIWLGKISYGVYAIHLPIYLIVRYVLVTTRYGQPIVASPILLACVTGITVIVLADRLTSYVDEPLRRSLRKLLATQRRLDAGVTEGDSKSTDYLRLASMLRRSR